VTHTGRWAPSPTGDLHLGNLRTALLAWLFARSAGGRFVWRFEDLGGAVRAEYYDSQLRDIAALGIDWDGEPIRQSDRADLYADALTDLEGRGLTYRCWCSRREIREAAAAPHEHLPEGAYPGTCRDLASAEVRKRESTGRPPALRLRTDAPPVTFVDRVAGPFSGVVDDAVLRRGDGTPSYNLAVVIDDDAQGVTEVVRGDDLLASTPRQIHIAHLLGVEPPSYAHVALVTNAGRRRLANRDGAITLADRIGVGETAIDCLNLLLESLRLPRVARTSELEAIHQDFEPQLLPREPWIFEG